MLYEQNANSRRTHTPAGKYPQNTDIELSSATTAALGQECTHCLSQHCK